MNELEALKNECELLKAENESLRTDAERWRHFSGGIPIRPKEWKTKQFEEAGGKRLHCYICGKLVKMHESNVDHLIAKSKGGLNVSSNYGLTCRPCNSKKAAKFRFIMRRVAPKRQWNQAHP